MSQTHKEIVEDTTDAIVEIFRWGRKLLSPENGEKVAALVKEVLESPKVGNAIETIEKNPLCKAIEEHVDNVAMQQLVKINKITNK
jgi:hypothetical protein